MTIAIVTDSTCDLGQAAEFAYQIDMVPLTVSFGNTVYRDAVDLSGNEFYTLLSKSSTLPTTSQPAPAAFAEVFRRRLDEGKEVIAILLSSVISGTYQSATIARDALSPDEQVLVHLIDSRNATGCLGILVLEAVRMRDAGAGAEEICDHVNSLVPRVRLYAILDTLRYLRMGGRLSAAAAVAGGLLNTVPIVSMREGNIIAAAKIRKSQNAFRKWLRDRFKTEPPDQAYPVLYLHSGNIAVIDQLQEEFQYLLPQDKIFRLFIGSVVGTHAGTGAAGIAYVTKAE